MYFAGPVSRLPGHCYLASLQYRRELRRILLDTQYAIVLEIIPTYLEYLGRCKYVSLTEIVSRDIRSMHLSLLTYSRGCNK